MLSSFKDPVPQISCICYYIKRKDIGLGNIKGPYPRAWNFQGEFNGTIYANFRRRGAEYTPSLPKING